MEQYISDYVVFDLETTGISSTYDEVIEISGIKVRKGRVIDEYTSLVNPGRPIPWNASQVNGITDDMVMDAPEFQNVLPEFLEFLGEDVLVGHNIHNFDMRFIYRDTEKYYGKIPGNDYVDTLSVARNYLPQLSHYRLADLASFYNISVRGAHRALNDCRMNQQVYEHLAKEIEKAEKERAEIEKLGIENAGKDNPGLKRCPRCGQIMKIRNGRFGQFWGCSGYPGCRHTENI